MSNNNPRQGQSIITIDKERGIASALSIGMSIAKGVISKAPKRRSYWHLDANAGCGRNKDVHCDGSPLVFNRLFDERMPGLHCEAYFCDKNRTTLRELEVRLCEQWPNSHLLPGDNEEAIQVFAECIRRNENPAYAVGTVISDPNGYHYRNVNGDGPPVKGLVRFTKEFPRIDIVLNINTQAGRRQLSAGHYAPAPADVLASLNKSYWLVKRTQAAGQEFLLAVGRNIKTGDHRSLGFFKLESEEGQSIIRTVTGDWRWSDAAE